MSKKKKKKQKGLFLKINKRAILYKLSTKQNNRLADTSKAHHCGTVYL